MTRKNTRTTSTSKIHHLQRERRSALSNAYSFNGKPYNFFGDYLRQQYGFRVFKLPIDAGLGCPNREQGDPCLFCSDTGSASPAISGSNDITVQMDSARRNFCRTDVETKYIAYFQAYTNTYADLSALKKLYDTALAYPGVIGLMIGTRPDCIDENIAALIHSYKRDNFELWVELGMQSAHDSSLQSLSRHHSHADTEAALSLLDRYGIQSCVHLILGIPGETRYHMMATAEKVAELPIAGVKMHHLHVLRHTPLEKMYNHGNVQLLSREEYTSLLCDFLELIPREVLVHRLSGDALEDDIVAPRWGLEKGSVQKSIVDEFTRRGSWQGFLLDDLS